MKQQQPKDDANRFAFRPDQIPPALIEAAEAALSRQVAGDLAGWDPDAPEDPGLDEPYPDWNENNSRVISGPIGDTRYPGRPAETWQGARAYAVRFAGDRGVKMFKFWTVPGRWFARVGKNA